MSSEVPEPPHVQSLFLFPIVFGINLIHFFNGKNIRTGQNLIICLGFSITRHAARTIQERVGTKRANFWAAESVNCEFQGHNGETGSVKGEMKMRFFGKGKCELTAIVRFFGMGKCKLIANFSATMMTSLPSISLSLSLSLSLYLSLSLSLSHRAYLTHNIGSASGLPLINVFNF